MRYLVLLTLLAGCTAYDPQEPTREQQQLAQELDERVAGEPRNCIPSDQSQSLTIVDESTIVSRRGKTIWVNRLRSPCPGLRPSDTLIVQVSSGQYCRSDQVRGVTPGSSIPGPICILGEFVPYAAR